MATELLTRRAVLRAIPAIGVAAAVVPTIAMAQASRNDLLASFLSNASPSELIHYHGAALAEALNAANPGERWIASFGMRDGFVLCHRAGQRAYVTD